MTKKLTGPDLWYQGCPNLIFYSKFYGNKSKITMKELKDRKLDLDEQIRNQIELVAALNDATELLKKSPQVTDKIISICEQNKGRLNSGLDSLREQWEIVDGASIELEQKNKIV
jgi:hypothetical protein